MMADHEYGTTETVTVTNVAKSVRRALRTLIVLTFVLYVALAGTIGWVTSTSIGTRDALCALRADLESRVQQSQQFLDHQPKGSFSNAIRTSISGQRRTIKALGSLSC